MSESKSTVNYLFGDSDRAAQRLELLARIFHDSTRVLLLKAAKRVAGIARQRPQDRRRGSVW